MLAAGDRNPDYPPKEDFLHADELVAFIRRRGDFGGVRRLLP